MGDGKFLESGRSKGWFEKNLNSRCEKKGNGI